MLLGCRRLTADMLYARGRELNPQCCIIAEGLRNHLQMPYDRFGVSQSGLGFLGAVDLLETCCCIAACEQQDHLQMLRSTFEIYGQFMFQITVETSAEVAQSCCVLSEKYEGSLSRNAMCQI